jgi:ribosomal protein L4
MVLYSKVVTIRDKQIEENKRLEKEWVEEQKKLDLMMEIERLKILKIEEEREAKKAEMRIKGKQVIIDQIQDRTLQRMKEQEIRDKERIQLLANIDKMKREDEIQ